MFEQFLEPSKKVKGVEEEKMTKKSFFPVWRGVVFVLVLGLVLATVGIRTATAASAGSTSSGNKPPRPPITNPIDRMIWEFQDMWEWIQGLSSGLA